MPIIYRSTDYYQIPQKSLDTLKDPNTIIIKSTSTDGHLEEVPDQEWITKRWGRNTLRMTIRKTGIHYKILSPDNEVLEYHHVAGGQLSGIYQTEAISEFFALSALQERGSRKQRTLQIGLIAGKDFK